MFSTNRIARGLCAVGAMITLGGVSVGAYASTTFAAGVGAGTTAAVGNPNYATAGKQCDPSRDGYHFIMNGLEFASGAVITGADFGPINITFSNGSTAVALFTDRSGPTAHFLNSTVNQMGNFTISSAQMTFPAGTDITGFNQFRISHPPCGTVGSTTTTEDTTTTEAATTTTEYGTTAEDTTTTTEYGTTAEDATTTTEYGTTAEDATTTTENATTTTEDETSTAVAVLSEVPLLPTIAPLVSVQVASEAVAPAALPVTGRDAGTISILGLFVLGSGLTLWGLSRRPRPLEG